MHLIPHTRNLIRSALSNPSGLLSQKLFHSLTSAAQCITFFYLIQLNLAQANILKASKS